MGDVGKLRRSWIHAGLATEYSGTARRISLGRGTPGFFGPQAPPTIEPHQFRTLAGAAPLPYPPREGLAELRRGVARYCVAKYGLPVTSDRVIITNGGTQAIDVAFKCIRITQGELRVAFLTPTWLSLPKNQVTILGGTSVEFAARRVEDGWFHDPCELRSRLQADRVNAVFAVTPGNPTGAISAEFPDIQDAARQCRASLIADITYASMLYDAQAVLPLDRQHARDLFLVGSFSKAFAVPGLRLGYLIAPEQWVDTCEDLVEAGTMGVNTFSQQAGLALLADCEISADRDRDIVGRMRQRALRVERALVMSRLEFIPPRAGYYAFARVPPEWSNRSEDFAKMLFSTTGVEIVPGTEFGEGFGSYVRISFGNPETDEDLDEACARLVALLRSPVELLTAAGQSC